MRQAVFPLLKRNSFTEDSFSNSEESEIKKKISEPKSADYKYSKKDLIEKIRGNYSQNKFIKNGKCTVCDHKIKEDSLDSDDKTKTQKYVEEKVAGEQENPYPEIKVPNDFRIKFEISKGFDHGESLRYARREVKDELVIRYLQAQYKRLE